MIFFGHVAARFLLHYSSMTQTDPRYLLLLAASWLLFGVSHSLLAGTTLERLFGRHSRIAFNGVAVVMTAIPFVIGASLPANLLWEEPNWLRWARHGVSVVAVLAFFHTLKFYSLPAFLGLKFETWLVSASCITLYLILGSRIEEKRILRHHPGSYAQYCRIVPALIPWRGRALDETTRLRLESQALTET